MRTLSAPPTGSRCKRWTPRTSPWWRWCYEAPVLTTTDATETWPWGWTCWTWWVVVSHLCPRIALDRFGDREIQQIRDDRVVSKREEESSFWFPNEQKSHIFEFFQSFPIFFLSLLRVRDDDDEKSKRTGKFLPADSSSSRCLRDESENASERQKPKTTTTFLLFVFERSRFKRERKRDWPKPKTSSFHFFFLSRHDDNSRAKC